MDLYEGACDKLKDIDYKKDSSDLDDFEEFMRKVEEVNKMVHALTSNNKSEIEEATQNANIWLKNQKTKKSKEKETTEEIINEPVCGARPVKKINKAVINEKAFEKKKEESLNNSLNCETMSQEAFMRSVEEDAKKRSEDRKQRQIESDAIKAEAGKSFSTGDYEKALDLYNKAINVRKDSSVLYINRALTLLKLGLNSRALNDCETALKLNENSFKATLFKGKAYFQMGEEDKADEWMREAEKTFPERAEEIREYQKSWYEIAEEETL